MYSAPKIYEALTIEEPRLSMYKMRPIYDESGADSTTTCDKELQERQDLCLEKLEQLQHRLNTLQSDCCEKENTSKFDIVIGCAVGTPAVYLAAVIATKANCLIKIFSHSSNNKEVDDTITNKLLRINHGESHVTGITLIYKNVTAPHFMASPGRQVPVSGTSNLLRYISRERRYRSYYNEADLEQAALVDEILALTDSLEHRIVSGSSSSDIGQLLNTISSYLKSSPYLTGPSLTIADVALCCNLAAMDPKLVPNSLKSYLTNTVKSNHEMKVLRVFLDWVSDDGL